MDTIEVVGKIKKLQEVQTFSSGFIKRELVLLTQEQYPQTLAIEFLQDKVSLLDRFNEGDDVKIAINLRGREWVNPEGVAKYFNSLVAWRIEPLIVQAQPAAVVAAPVAPAPPVAETFNSDFNDLNEDDDADDLPF